MKRAKLLAVAAAIAFASVSFASEAFAGVTGVIIYLGPGYPIRIRLLSGLRVHLSLLQLWLLPPLCVRVRSLLERPLAAALAALALTRRF